MSHIYFTVGPSQIYPTVKEHTLRALTEDVFSLNHRGKQFEELYASVDRQLKKLLLIPDEYSIFLLSSGTEAMERIIQNTVAKQSFHIVTGTFGDRFYKAAEELGKKATEHVYNPLKVFRASDVTRPADAELIAFTHNDTSTGMQIPADEIYAIGKQNPDALIAVDAVSSMPYMDIDYTKVDCVFFSVQKGFGMPAGLGVLIVSPRALKKSHELVANGISTGSYHSFASLSEYEAKSQTPDTPNVLGIYLLSHVLGDFLQIGIDTIRSETEQKAQMLYQFFQSSNSFAPLIKDADHQSQTTIVAEVAGGSEDLLKSLKEKGFIVGSGYGKHKHDHIRIANFPAHSINNVEGLIDLLKSA
ncbi:MAG TPA: aminotransferase class V-fold PLP-dependent enzyme [Candidatus Levybacteria bacterium]|nr:aminotransferase class V-fold PLP-dependent enzyme [Candidatus Levybacteria bacterium]